MLYKLTTEALALAAHAASMRRGLPMSSFLSLGTPKPCMCQHIASGGQGWCKRCSTWGNAERTRTTDPPFAPHLDTINDHPQRSSSARAATAGGLKGSDHNGATWYFFAGGRCCVLSYGYRNVTSVTVLVMSTQ